MPSVKQLLPILFNTGLDTKSDPNTVQGKLLDLKNGVFTKEGGISKRWGYTAFSQKVLGSSTPISSGVAINHFNNELLMFDGYSGYSYSPTKDNWLSRGSVVSVIETNQEVVRNNYYQSAPDTATLQNITVVAWEDSSGGIRYSVIDKTTNTLLVSNQSIYIGMGSGLYRPKVIAFPQANQILIFFTNNAGVLYFCPVSPYYPTVINTAPIVMNAGLSTPTYYDAQLIGSNVYVVASKSSALSVQFIDINLQINNSANVGSWSSPPTGCINVVGDKSNNVWISWADGYNSMNVKSACYTNDLHTTLLSPTVVLAMDGVVASVAAIASSTYMNVYAEATGTQTYNNHIYSNIVSTTFVGSQYVFARSVGLASKPFYANGNLYVNVVFSSNLQPTYFTLTSNGQVISKINPGISGGLVSQNNDYMLPECVQVSSNVFQYANLVKSAVNANNGSLQSFLGVNLTQLDFHNSNQFMCAPIGYALYVVGGIVQRYDGSQFMEHGFNVYPENITFTTSSTGGNLAAGTYSYVVNYEYTDNSGENEYSTPSVPLTVAISPGTSTNSVTLTIPTLRLTVKSGVRIVVYRNTPTLGGTLLYRVSSITNPIYNNTAVDTVTFTDTLSDAVAESNSLLYTQPLASGDEILENAAPPACSLICTYHDRLFIAGMEDPNQLWYTKERVIGSPIEFSAYNTLEVDPKGGNITGIAVLNNNLIIFKEHAIFYLQGNGPTDNGENNDFNSPGPIHIPSTVGCIQPNSIVEVGAMGLMFQSDKGIYLIDPSLNVVYIGKQVEQFNNLTITSATVVPSQWVIFTTTSGIALVYDYLENQWGTFTNHYAIDSDTFQGNNNAFVYIATNGQVYQQSLTNFTDVGNHISLSFTTSWILPGDALQGYSSLSNIYLLGGYRGNHKLMVNLGFDYQQAFTSFTNITETRGVYGTGNVYGSNGVYGGDSAPYQFQINVGGVKCQAFRIQVYDLPPALLSQAPNEGFYMSAMTARCNVRPGAHKKVPYSRQVPNS